MPLGIKQGDFLFMAVKSTSTESPTITWPTGWTEDTQGNNSSQADKYGFAHKAIVPGTASIPADGSESSSDQTLTTSAAIQLTALVVAVRGGVKATLGGLASGHSTAANVASIPVAGGWKAFLYLLFGVTASDFTTVAAAGFPSPYDLNGAVQNNGQIDSACLVASRQKVDQGDENPAAFGGNLSSYRIYLIAVEGRT